jgi:hypothetical protein
MFGDVRAVAPVAKTLQPLPLLLLQTHAAGRDNKNEDSKHLATVYPSLVTSSSLTPADRCRTPRTDSWPNGMHSFSP